MSTTMQSLGIDRMTVEERLSLLQEIRESIDAEGVKVASMGDVVGVTEARAYERDRRPASMDPDPTAMRPQTEVEARLLAGSKNEGIIAGETALLSERSLAGDWDRLEEDAAWSHLQPVRIDQGVAPLAAQRLAPPGQPGARL